MERNPVNAEPTMERRTSLASQLLAFAAAMIVTVSAWSDVPLRAPPYGAVPNPGTQQKELTNITAPAEFNVFEFVVTCAGCHGGTIDQHAGHFGNWAGGNMASAARDPVFRANQILTNDLVKNLTGTDGAGNVCFRCHSSNGWLSGRFDPYLGGKADGSTLMNSILMSTDAEGVNCETCHRVAGAVAYKRTDPVPAAEDDPNTSLGLMDKVWSLLAGITDWPHQGRDITDQTGVDPSIGDSQPYGDTTLQFQDNISYVGKYSGTGDLYFSDLPIDGTPYTGQIYGVYPDWWIADPANPVNPVPAGEPEFNSAGQKLAYGPDGSLPPVFEVPIGVPFETVVTKIKKNKSIPTNVSLWSLQGLSLEHPTTGSAQRLGSTVDPGEALPELPTGPQPGISPNEFIRTSEFCGACHELTVPVLNHGMPEQRTFSEWKYSAYSQATNDIEDPLGKRIGKGVERCQDCHMPTLKHEYSDDNTDSLNADPVLAGTFPYAKNRGPQGGTSFHKLTGANRDLPMMMKALYPEVDLELLGAPTGNDPRVFPGMLSDRGPMWDRAIQNTEITLRDAVDVQILSPGLNCAGNGGTCTLTVQVQNKSGHRIPSGYPDGRRFWLAVNVTDANGNIAYQSGVYDEENAELLTAVGVPFNRAQAKSIDATVAGGNAVMVYERVTGMCYDEVGKWIFPDPTSGTPATCKESTALVNNFILFDNRVPPKGLDYDKARLAGVKFWNYDAVSKLPFEDETRYDANELLGGYDVVTYTFTPPDGVTPAQATVDVYWQTHTREFMEYLRDNDKTTVRPQGPPNPFALGYPNTPYFLSTSINGKDLSAISDPFNVGMPLNDNWGGVAYAAWLETGMGAPYRVDSDSTSAPALDADGWVVSVDKSGETDLVNNTPDIFGALITWDRMAGADGYMIWMRYGANEATADWDRLAVVPQTPDGVAPSHTERVLNPAKTYGFKVVAFNGADESTSDITDYTTPEEIPLAPTGLTASSTAPGSTDTQITLSWTDNATNDACFDVWRFDVVAIGEPPLTEFLCNAVNNAPATTGPITGPTSWVDTTNLLPNKCYDYQVRAQNNAGEVSTFTQLARGCTLGQVQAITLTATSDESGTFADLKWAWDPTANPDVSFRVVRDGTLLETLPPSAGVVDPDTGILAFTYTDAPTTPGATYLYKVEVISAGDLIASGTAPLTMAGAPAAPTNFLAVVDAEQAKLGVAQLNLSWRDAATTEQGFTVERSPVIGGVATGYTWLLDRASNQDPILGYGSTGDLFEEVDSTVQPGTTYRYRVQATNADTKLSSPWVYSADATTKFLPPGTPTIASVLIPTKGNKTGKLVVTFTVPDKSSWVLVRSATDPAVDPAPVWTTVSSGAGPVTNFSVTDSGLASKTTYYYEVRASNPDFTTPSTVASGTTQ